MHTCMCLCLRTENRSRKTHVFEYRDCGVEWGGVGGHVNVPCTSYMIYCHAAEISGIVYYVTCCYAVEISGIVYYVTCCYAAEISGIVYYVTCCYAAEISGIVYYITCCYAAEISGIVYYVTCSMWNLMKKSIPSNLSAKSDLLMVYARAWQWRCIHKNADCQLITVHASQRWRWKAKKRAPSLSRISNHQISTALW